jgi:hypothetical protein
MAVTYIRILNYIAFLLFYLLCFYAISNNKIQIIGYSFLFLFNTSFILFFSKDMYEISGTLFDTSKENPMNKLSILVCITVFIALCIHSVSLLLIILTLWTLTNKYYNFAGSAFSLDNNYYELLKTFDGKMHTIFGICTVLLFMVYYTINGYTYMNIKINFFDLKYLLEFIKYFVREPMIVFKNREQITKYNSDKDKIIAAKSALRFDHILFPLLNCGLTISVLYMCYQQMNIANEFSKLYNRAILGSSNPRAEKSNETSNKNEASLSLTSSNSLSVPSLKLADLYKNIQNSSPLKVEHQFLGN